MIDVSESHRELVQRLLAYLLPILDRLAVNRAIAYLLMTRLWQSVSMPVTIALIVKFFTPTTQDFYYLFGPLLAAQILIELGLSTILIILSSHEWAGLQLNADRSISGSELSRSRLASLDRGARHVYQVCALLFLIGVGGAGVAFISSRSATQHEAIFWQGPWLAAVAANAVCLLLLPRLSILEGCNQVAAINWNRFCQGIAGSVVVWGCIAGGAGLWTVAVSNLVRWGWEFALVNGRYRPFFASLNSATSEHQIDWRDEIWPLQWRLAIQSVASFLSSQFLVLVVFRYGEVGETGQLAATLSILTAIQMVGLAWVQTRMPEFGMLAAKRDLAGLERRLKQTGSIAVLVFVLGSAALLVLLVGLRIVKPAAADRFLSLPATGMLILALLATQLAIIFHGYVRVHKQDPFLIVNCISGAGLALLVWYFGKYHGAFAACAAYAGFGWAYTLPVSAAILLKYRRRFQIASETSSP